MLQLSPGFQRPNNTLQVRSVYGYVKQVNEQVIPWRSRVTPIVRSSTTQAEFVTVALPLREVEWIHKMLQETELHFNVSVIYGIT